MSYTISQVSEQTGFSATCLRVWEERYGWPRPRRDRTGFRIYSDTDVAEIRAVRVALDAGGVTIRDLIDSDGKVRVPERRLPAPLGDPRRSSLVKASRAALAKFSHHPGAWKLGQDMTDAIEQGNYAKVISVLHQSIRLRPSDRSVICAPAYAWATEPDGRLKPDHGSDRIVSTLVRLLDPASRSLTATTAKEIHERAAALDSNTVPAPSSEPVPV